MTICNVFYVSLNARCFGGDCNITKYSNNNDLLYKGIYTFFLYVCRKLKNDNEQTTPSKFNIMFGRLSVDSAGLK